MYIPESVIGFICGIIVGVAAIIALASYMHYRDKGGNDNVRK